MRGKAPLTLALLKPSQLAESQAIDIPLPMATNPAHPNGEQIEEPLGEPEPMSSDSEGVNEPLEVSFGDSAAQRRRASISTRPGNPRQSTSCFVHTLLHSGVRSGTLDDEGIAQRSPADPTPDQEADAHTQSRHLTKQQLSDMALGIRELSKKLGKIQVKLKVRNVFLLTKAHDQSLVAKTRSMAKWLLEQKSLDGHFYTVWVENTLERNEAFNAEDIVSKDPSYQHRLRYWTTELCRKKPHTWEIVLALGGDGTVLYASWLFQRIVPPVMSFAGGSLGFLTKFDFQQYPETLTKAFRDGVTVSVRLRFEATIMRSKPREHERAQHQRDLVEELVGTLADDISTHYPDGSHSILNDCVCDRGPAATMSGIEVFGDSQHFTTVQGDGICVSTPTGSTAYNLACGGSLVHPEAPVLLITAIAPHALNFRPLVLPDTIVLRIGVPYDARASCWASFDGKERCELKAGDYVTISASRFPFPSVLPLDRKNEDWVDSLSRTLSWNKRTRQKAFDDSPK